MEASQDLPTPPVYRTLGYWLLRVVAQDVHCTLWGPIHTAIPGNGACWASAPNTAWLYSAALWLLRGGRDQCSFFVLLHCSWEFQDPSRSQIHHHSHIPVTACLLEDAPVTASTHIPC